MTDINGSDLIWLEDMTADLGLADGGGGGWVGRAGGHWATPSHDHQQVADVSDVRDCTQRMVHHYLLQPANQSIRDF